MAEIKTVVPVVKKRPVPVPPVGATVQWWSCVADANNPDCQPGAAMVTRTGTDSVALAVFEPSATGIIVRDGVLHVSDERTKDPFRSQGGVWDFVPAH